MFLKKRRAVNFLFDGFHARSFPRCTEIPAATPAREFFAGSPRGEVTGRFYAGYRIISEFRVRQTNPENQRNRARSSNLFSNAAWIEIKARRLAQKFNLKIYALAVNFDHIHLALKIPQRREYTAFIRAFTSLLARKIGAGLWMLLPFTRVVAWGKDFRQVLSYLKKNREEVGGVWLMRSGGTRMGAGHLTKTNSFPSGQSHSPSARKPRSQSEPSWFLI